MSTSASHIPSEVFVGFLGRSIEIHWNYHALVMVFVWAVVVPACVTAMRFHKPAPSLRGIRRDVSLWHREWWFFSVHKFGMFFGMFVALSAGGIAFFVSGTFSGSVHAYLGALTLLMGLIQIISSQLRGSRGGKYREGANPNDPATWRGDQYDRTIRRRVFEAVHRTCGYFSVILAFGAVGSGLVQYQMPVLATTVLVICFFWLAVWVRYEFKERAYDGYRVAHGYGLEHPYNKEREFL